MSGREEQGHRAIIDGLTSLQRAKVDGPVCFSGACLKKSLTLAYSRVTGGFSCDTIEGYHTEIGGDVEFEDATISVELRLHGVKADGNLNLRFATINGVLSCVSDTNLLWFAGIADLHACRANRMTLYGWLCGPRDFSLRLARISELEFTKTLPASLSLDGCQYEKLTLPEGTHYLKFLAATKPFSRSDYAFLENWLKNQGYSEEAKRTYIERRRRERREGKTGISRIGDCVLDVSTGYGERSYRLLAYLLLVIGLSTWLFSQSQALHREPESKTSQTASEPREISGLRSAQPTLGDAFWSAVQVNLPVVSLKNTEGWRPSTQPISLFGGWLTYRQYAAFVSTINWIVIPLFLAGITGLVRRQA